MKVHDSEAVENFNRLIKRGKFTTLDGMGRSQSPKADQVEAQCSNIKAFQRFSILSTWVI